MWGLFMGVSSNTRYQIVFGLERMVDMSIAKKVTVCSFYFIAWAASSMPRPKQDHPCPKFAMLLDEAGSHALMQLGDPPAMNACRCLRWHTCQQ